MVSSDGELEMAARASFTLLGRASRDVLAPRPCREAREKGGESRDGDQEGAQALGVWELLSAAAAPPDVPHSGFRRELATRAGPRSDNPGTCTAAFRRSRVRREHRTCVDNQA